MSQVKKISIFCDESGSTVRSSVVNANIENKYVKILVSRLIGVEGIMAVQAVEQKNYKLLIEALKETT